MADHDQGRPVRRKEWAKLWAEHGHANSSPSRGAVAGWLYSTARGDGTHASASVPWLAGVSGRSQATVKRVIGSLKAELWLALRERGHYRGPNRPPTANVYDLTAPAELVDNLPVDNSPTAHPDDPLDSDANSSKSDANSSPRMSRPCSSTNYPARGARQEPRRAARQPQNRAAGWICRCGNSNNPDRTNCRQCGEPRTDTP